MGFILSVDEVIILNKKLGSFIIFGISLGMILLVFVGVIFFVFSIVNVLDNIFVIINLYCLFFSCDFSGIFDSVLIVLFKFIISLLYCIVFILL